MGRKCKDYSGQVCGVWEVIERDWNPASKSHETFWKAKCSRCGNISSVRKTDLDKKPRSCNNCKGDIIADTRYENGDDVYRVTVGMEFGLLTVLSRPFVPKGKVGKSYCWCRCDCGNEILVRKDHLFGAHRKSRTISCGCASASSGEIKIQKLLDKMGIKYIPQYRIKEFSQYAPFDIAIIKDDKVIGLIEYDGEQHFMPVEFFGGEEKFIAQQEIDERKNKYCEQNNIPLVRIPYTDYNSITEEYLNSCISRF